MKLMKVKKSCKQPVWPPTIYKYMAKGLFPKPVSLGGQLWLGSLTR